MDKHYDVVVVGSGNAALCSAISAGESGASVLILEKGPKHKRGGNSFFTDGAIRSAYGDIEGIQNIIPELTSDKVKNIRMPIYNETDYYNDIMDVTQNKSNPALADHLVSHSYSTILWMKEQGVKFQLNENQYFESDGMFSFWGGLPLKTVEKGIGLINTLFDRAEELGIDIEYETKATQLEKTDNKISGIFTEDKQGNTSEIITDSVILACGGFEADQAKRAEFLGEKWMHAIVRGSEYNTGDGIDIAIEAGAQRAGQYDGCHAHTTDYNAPPVGDFEKPGDIYKKSSYPLGLIVNMDGQRFVDEGADFRNYTYAKYGKETLNQPGRVAFQIYDSQVRSKLRKEYDLEEATVYKADSTHELADKMEIEAEAFSETINAYNHAVQEGEYDPSIKDGKGTKGITPPKSNWALKLEEPPFYAYPVTCGITFTFGAVRVNNKSEVISEDGEPIPGLYAAGEMVGDLFYHNYPGGSGLMSGAVFGKTAGESATANMLKR